MASENNPGGAGDMEAELMPLDFEENLAVSESSAPDSKFDSTIGFIEEIIMEEEFQQIQQGILEKYYSEFEDSEENKFVYSDAHKEYIEIIEKYLQKELCERMPDFCMTEFQKQLIQRKEELEGEVFEMLLTFSDFLSFKEMVLDYKNEKEGNTVDLSSGLCVRSLSEQPPQPASKNLASQSDNYPSNIHNLDIGGQSIMISGGGASNMVDLFTVNGAGQSLSSINNHLSTEQSEGMNISPRPDDHSTHAEMDH